MASTSASRSDGVIGRIRRAASNLYSDNQTLVTDIRKSLNFMREIAVDLERDNQTEMVKQLEDAVVELVEAHENCLHYSSAIQSVGDAYQPGTELTDFKKLLDTEFEKVKASSSSSPQNHPLIHQFRQAVWNVHHAGQPMPGEEQEDIVLTSTESNIKNLKCPLTGKPITELTEPVRSVDCKHIYERNAILDFIKSKRGNAKCPVSACPKMLQAKKVTCDPLLLFEIEEQRSLSEETARTGVIEDFTEMEAS
ncbi:E3 SUMO-protein ligase MMS21 isoform X1 [Durio zibethinus]|uniref:E3 SUMO-protein ligase MMS21 isoform X1 n=1 Tax=Durio zibethinus TaxID=66656 RepID=A0A6P5WMF9_DURZI|nr:E3 SUMO-protein ligase MMS21 isoform X1 [Durio zibethinus]